MPIPKLINSKFNPNTKWTIKEFQVGEKNIHCTFDSKNRLINWTRKSSGKRVSKGCIKYKTFEFNKVKTTKIISPEKTYEITATYLTKSNKFNIKRDKQFILEMITKKVTNLLTGVTDTTKIKAKKV